MRNRLVDRYFIYFRVELPNTDERMMELKPISDAH